jgi:hypothetical protein
VLLLPPADDETRADLAVKRETVTPFWWALKTLLKVGWGHSLHSLSQEGMEALASSGVGLGAAPFAALLPAHRRSLRLLH